MTARRQNLPAKKWMGVSGLVFGLVFGLGVGPSSAQTTSAKPFIAHRAIYDLVLEADPSRPAVESGSGRIVFEFSGSVCEGFTQNFRQVMSLEGSEFGQRLVDSRSLSFEEAGQKAMHFSGSLKVNDAEPEDTDGTVEKVNGGLKIALTKPETATTSVQGAAMFPTEHYQQIVRSALAGQAALETRVFDGSGDGKTVSDSFAVIGKQLPESKAGDAITKAGFATMKRWPVTISFFDGEGSDRETPSYVMSMQLLENGIADALVLNYGDFIMKGTLRQLEILPQKACP